MNRTQNPFLHTLRLPVKRSPIIFVVVVFVHIISLFLPWITDLSRTYKILLTIVPIFNMIYYVAKYFLISKEKRVLELILGSDDDWQVKMENGLSHPAVLGSVLFVHPLLTIITLTFNQSKHDFIFTPEVIDPEQFRRLRVRLKFKVD